MKNQYRRKLIDTVDSVIGDVVSDIINKYYGDLVESDHDYEKVLYAIARYVRQEVFGGRASLNEIVDYLTKLRSKKNFAKLVLSYLIARALEEGEEVPAV